MRGVMKQVGAGLVLMALAATGTALAAQRPALADPPFKVKIDFNRWHDVPELYADMARLARAWPKFLSLSSIGKSYRGRDLMLMTINNPDTGPEDSKAAMYIEANIHGNEIQGAEVCLYTIWYLMENYGRIEQITQLVDERVFYIVPTVNPDGRQCFFEDCGNARTGQLPYDNDNDGLDDEDGPNDLNGNGVIEQIRKYVPGKGTHRLWQEDPRVMQPVPPGETGDYIILGEEGIDDDGDGAVNEDDAGGYDPNRNFASDWQPEYVQGGALQYPFQLSESRAVNDFLMAHPNIAGVQSYHNAGGMLLRGPGAEWLGELNPQDLRVYDEIGRTGERMLPYYRYMLIWRDLYTVHGGMTDWTNDGLGIISFANELWNYQQYFGSPELQKQQADPASPISSQRSQYFFGDHLEFGASYLPWQKFKHPQFGEVEIGGTWTPLSGRVPPRFMNEELSHRNMAFTLFHAGEMPQVNIGEVEVSRIGGDVYRVWVDIENPKLIPTITVMASGNGVVRPDLLTVQGRNVEVIAAGWIGEGRYANKEVARVRHAVTRQIDQEELDRIQLREGAPGQTTRTLEYLLRGSGEVTVTYDSVKGGKVTRKVRLRESD